jgi:hypothetical protein
LKFLVRTFEVASAPSVKNWGKTTCAASNAASSRKSPKNVADGRNRPPLSSRQNATRRRTRNFRSALDVLDFALNFRAADETAEVAFD